jgi:hypothetical protein
MLRSSLAPISSEWTGGRGGSTGYYEEDWCPTSSWAFEKRVLASLDIESVVWFKLKVYGDFRPSVRLRLDGDWLKASTTKCVPKRATANLQFTQGQHISLGEVSCKSVKSAKEWADSLDFSKQLRQLLHQRLSEDCSTDVEMCVDGEWVHWLCSFAQDSWSATHWPIGKFRILSRTGTAMLLVKTNSSWSTSSWPSAWDVIASDRERLFRTG